MIYTPPLTNPNPNPNPEQEGMIYLPFWMMENMHLNEGDIVHLKRASIQKGSFVKLQPQTSDFIKISNPKAVLEQSLRSFSALTKGETFRILYNKKKYDIGVVEVRPEGRAFQPGAARGGLHHRGGRRGPPASHPPVIQAVIHTTRDPRCNHA